MDEIEASQRQVYALDIGNDNPSPKAIDSMREEIRHVLLTDVRKSG